MDPNFFDTAYKIMIMEYEQNQQQMFQQQNTFSSSSAEDNYFDRMRRHRAAVVGALNHVVEHEVPQLFMPRRIHQRRYIERDWGMGHDRIYNDYFAANSVYPEAYFRRRYRMRKNVFLRIQCKKLVWHMMKSFNSGKIALDDFFCLLCKKITAAMFMLGYGQFADKDDHYTRIGESTARVALLKFCEAEIANFRDEYMRKPTAVNLQRLLAISEQRGFPGIMRSIDCMYWEWKNCLVAWKGMYQGRSGKASLVLEVVASQDTWIRHSFFGVPGSCNDLNVLYRSPLFDDLLNGRAPRVSFEVNGHLYDKGYYLIDGIYPQWYAFIKSITLPQTPKHTLFAQRQEATRKDVERTFGVLQSKFVIVKNPSLAWERGILHNIVMTCIILHNMIVENERETYANYDNTRDFYQLQHESRSSSNTAVQAEVTTEFSSNLVLDINMYLANRASLHDKRKHQILKADLIDMAEVWRGRN